MEADREHNLPSTCWRFAGAAVQTPSTGWWLKAQEEPVSQSESKGRRKMISQPEGSHIGRILSHSWGRRREKVSLLLYSGLQLFGQGPPALGRATCFTRVYRSSC